MSTNLDRSDHHTRTRIRMSSKWMRHAQPSDYLLALAEAYASIPLVGQHLVPLGEMTAMAVWGLRVGPEIAATAVRTRFSAQAGRQRRADARSTAAVIETALQAMTASAPAFAGPLPPRQLAPIAKAALHRWRYLHRASVAYGDVPGQRLDIWRRRDLPPGPAPVLVFVPGGGWIHGRRFLQGYALMSHLAEMGWICLSIAYRVSPHHRWPRHINDVKTAVSWARQHADEVGGDPDFVAVAGCSAGGHLAALTGLTAGQKDLHVELSEDANTAVDAVVSLYGRYDWADRSTPERERFVDFLERVVVKRRQSRHPAIFRDASPIARVHRNAPPFLVVHGTADTIIPAWQARAFVDELRAVSNSPVNYLELPGGHHGFDMTDGDRTAAALTVIGAFLANAAAGRTNAPR
jgi:acetyl esterase/lipase